jgi:EAL domain-containing protein (putative c-di-GMP-specific phosphodiesterase class I)
VRGPISPDKFIPLAEECGLIGKIGEWVLRPRCSEAANWPDHVASRSTCRRSSSTIPASSTRRRAARETGVDRAERLELEITEGVFLADSDTTDETFAR